MKNSSFDCSRTLIEIDKTQLFERRHIRNPSIPEASV